jgi:predicted metalloprotease with PDZ domain
MKNARFIWLMVFLWTTDVMAQQITYKVSLREPQTRYATVTIEIINYKKEELRLRMPVWTPGSYMVREFSRNVESVVASDFVGVELPVEKIDKNTWVLRNQKTQSFTLVYRVYANEMSVRTTFINDETAFLAGSSLFLLPVGLEHLPGKVVLDKPTHWTKIATGLKGIEDEPHTYSFAHYDELIDCPIQVGQFDTISFSVKGIPHYVALVGHSNVVKDKLKTDLQKICETTAAIVDRVDFSHYWFFVHHTDKGGGGLEHMNSTAVGMPRWNYSNEEQYLGFLRLCAHEYFHTWNVKRIRPLELGPFDYHKEVYTDLLWVAEGITTYYDKLIMYRAGYMTREKLLQSLAGSISYTENTPGGKVQTLAMASRDAWIKFYRPDENSINSSISYYTKGAVAALMLDLEIRRGSKNKFTLDDLLTRLYDEFYVKKNRGFSAKEFMEAASKLAGVSLDGFFNTMIYSTKSPHYDRLFQQFGIVYETKENPSPFLGLQVKYDQGKTLVTGVLRNSPAFWGGLTAGDEVISVNGVKPSDDFTAFLSSYVIDDQLKIHVLRGDSIKTFDLKLIKNPYPTHHLKVDETASPVAKSYLEKWL